MNCTQCKHPIALNQKFCTSCGRETKSVHQCSRCHQTLGSSSKYCTHCGNPTNNSVLSTRPSTQAQQLNQPLYNITVFASFKKRVQAAIIDFILIFASSLIIFIPTMLIFDLDDDEIMFFMVMSSLLYRAGMESSNYQGTIGKIIVGIKVVGMNSNRISFSRALFRYLASIISYMFFGFGYLLALFTKRKQTLHDLLVETVVVKR